MIKQGTASLNSRQQMVVKHCISHMTSTHELGNFQLVCKTDIPAWEIKAGDVFRWCFIEDLGDKSDKCVLGHRHRYLCTASDAAEGWLIFFGTTCAKDIFYLDEKTTKVLNAAQRKAERTVMYAQKYAGVPKCNACLRDFTELLMLLIDAGLLSPRNNSQVDDTYFRLYTDCLDDNVKVPVDVLLKLLKWVLEASFSPAFCAAACGQASNVEVYMDNATRVYLECCCKQLLLKGYDTDFKLSYHARKGRLGATRVVPKVPGPAVGGVYSFDKFRMLCAGALSKAK